MADEIWSLYRCKNKHIDISHQEGPYYCPYCLEQMEIVESGLTSNQAHGRIPDDYEPIPAPRIIIEVDLSESEEDPPVKRKRGRPRKIK